MLFISVYTAGFAWLIWKEKENEKKAENLALSSSFASSHGEKATSVFLYQREDRLSLPSYVFFIGDQ